MKKTGWIAFALLVAVALTGCNQESTAADQAVELWQIDYDGAVKQAAKENKFILVNVSGSEWCVWCKRLDKEVFSQPAFIEFARDNLICVLLDFDGFGKPVSTEFAARHQELLERYQVQGFPTVLIQNPQGVTVARTGYQPGGAENYINYIKKIIAGNQKK